LDADEAQSAFEEEAWLDLADLWAELADSFEQAERPTTLEEKQSLLLHEVLHIALDKDDDALTARDLCPLRLLAFCQHAATASLR